MRKQIKEATILLMMMVICLLSACGIGTKNSTKEVMNILEDTTEQNFEDTEDVLKPTFTETTEGFFVDNDIFDTTYVDGQEVPTLQNSDETQTLYVTNKEVNVYNTNKEGIGYLKKDVEVFLHQSTEVWTLVETSVNFNFYLIRTDDLSALDLVDINTTTTDEQTDFSVDEINVIMYATSTVNLRSGPSTDYDKIGELSINQEVQVNGLVDNGWYRIAYNGGDAYVSNSYISDKRVEENPTTPMNNSSSNANNSSSDTPNTSSDNTTPNNNTDNNVSEDNTPVETPTEDVQPETPTYSEAEVMSAVKQAMLNAGLQWYPDSELYQAHPEYGLTGGLGYGECAIAPGDLNNAALSIAISAAYEGHTYFYIVYCGIENGYVILEVFTG